MIVQATDTGLQATVFERDLTPRPELDGHLTLPGTFVTRPPYQPTVACDASGICGAVYRLGAEVWLQRFRRPVME